MEYYYVYDDIQINIRKKKSSLLILFVNLELDEKKILNNCFYFSIKIHEMIYNY